MQHSGLLPLSKVIERLWKTLHSAVTRNHWHRIIKVLMGSVRRLTRVCQPWSGSARALANA